MRDSLLIPSGFLGRRGPEGLELYRDPAVRRARRIRGILNSIHADIRSGSRVRVRRIVGGGAADVFRLELHRPELSCSRTTILDAEALETLLEELDEGTLRDAFRFA